jgi:hypothetical protein
MTVIKPHMKKSVESRASAGLYGAPEGCAAAGILAASVMTGGPATHILHSLVDLLFV